jgi:hypothetical protein
MTYGFDAEHLMVWIDSYERIITDRAGVLCRRHADAMVVPLGWMLDDRRDPTPRLFRAPAAEAKAAPRQRRAHIQQHDDTEQLELGADVLEEMTSDEAADVDEAVSSADETDVLPWKPTFDQTDDLDGLLEARSPLLARAFSGQDRRRPSR